MPCNKLEKLFSSFSLFVFISENSSIPNSMIADSAKRYLTEEEIQLVKNEAKNKDFRFYVFILLAMVSVCLMGSVALAFGLKPVIPKVAPTRNTSRDNPTVEPISILYPWKRPVIIFF